LNPYSHLVIAARVAPLLAPEDPPDYYWGAVAPDIRYVAGMRRSRTHLSAQRILGFIPQYPHLQSFIHGYLVHCIADEIDLEDVFFARLPFSALETRLPRQHLAVPLECFYVEKEPVDVRISGRHNDLLRALGVGATDAARLAEFVDRYQDPVPLDARIAELTQLLGLDEDPRIEKYAAAARKFEEQWLLKSALFLGIRVGSINATLVSQVSAKLQAIPAFEAAPDPAAAA
jgi:hypothetical protein